MKKEEKEFLDYLQLSKQSEEEYLGTEFEEEDDDIIEDEIPYNVQDIRVEQKMITVYQIEHWIESDMLNLKPEYQRNLVWNDSRKSALIESLMLKIPIPAFYLDEDTDGVKNVIDGMQRLSTIHDFLNDEFVLKKMQYLTKCEKKKFSELDIKFRSRIEETMLAVNILDERCPQMVKFDVFRRVNTGGVPLNPQEIRNIMAKSEVRILLKEMANSNEFAEATNLKVKDTRMGAQELCLRYLSILLNYDWENKELKNYFGLLKTMDSTILELNRMTDEQRDKILQDFKLVLNQCKVILKELSFCKLDNNKINKSLFTSWVVALNILKIDNSSIEEKAELIRNRYVEVLRNGSEFYDAITSSTGTKKHVCIALETIRNILEECI